MSVIISLVIWILLGIWGSNIMEKKGRSGVVGFIVGALLGLIGILILYLLSDNTKSK